MTTAKDFQPRFHIATSGEIKAGETTDIYFLRTKEVLQKKGINRRVAAEVTVGALPNRYPWGILSGVEEVASLMEGRKVNIDCMPEGSAFYPVEPVMRVEGNYKEFCEFETPLLGLLCQASGITTKAARMRKLAGKKTILSFGIRRMHPAIAPMIDRAAYIGGVEGFSGVAAEKLIGREAVGTMPHALIITVGDQVKAWQYFDEVVDKKVPRVALVDTYYDEKIEAVMAAEAVKGLQGVRLDTPSSRRGRMRRIAEEVRWELDIRGFKGVKIIVSGGVDEEAIKDLDNVDGFGIGTSISSASTIDFAMDIIEMEGRPCAKRGKFGGKKEVYRCTRCLGHKVVPLAEAGDTTCKACGGPMEPMLKPLIRDGELVRDLPSADEIHDGVLGQLERLEL